MTTVSNYEIAGHSIKLGETAYFKIPVCQTLDGNEMYLPCHVKVGTEPGPVLGLITVVHGDEPQPIEVLRRFWKELEPSAFKGVVLTIPVANPFAFARFARHSPEQHDGTNLSREFPGKPTGSLTSMIANTITQQIFSRIHYVIDYHSGGKVGRLQNRINCGLPDNKEVSEKTGLICRAFGTELIQEGKSGPGSAGHAAAQFGVAVCGAEIGGGYLAPSDSEYFIDIMLRGTRNVMKHLKMIPGEIVLPKKQAIYAGKDRIEIRPKHGGYLLSKFEKPEDVGREVKKGEVLGILYDPYSFKELHTMTSPVDGLLFFSRLSGVLEAGAQAFGVADLQKVRWV